MCTRKRNSLDFGFVPLDVWVEDVHNRIDVAPVERVVRSTHAVHVFHCQCFSSFLSRFPLGRLAFPRLMVRRFASV
jgi:hypothetical protein